MKRRALLAFAAGAAGFVFAGYRAAPGVEVAKRSGPVGPRLADLNPDRMWPVYRRYHLLIVGERDDAASNAFVAAVVDVLGQFLPGSRPQAVRAPDARRVGVLIVTDQQDVAIMAAPSAEALFLGRPPFDDIRNAPLRVLVSFGSYVLVCRPDFLARHAYLLAKTLAEHKEGLPAPVDPLEGAVPTHPGARAFFAGEEMPND